MDVTACFARWEDDTGSQMCLIPSKIFADLDVRPGYCVRVGDNLCKAFPYACDDDEDVVSVEPTVSLDPTSLSGARRGRRECRLEPVRRVFPVGSVSVTMWRDEDAEPEPWHGYEDAVKTFVEGMFVSDGCHVALDRGFAPFSRILVRLDGGTEGVCRISSKTSVKIVAAVGVERISSRLRLAKATEDLLPLESFSAARDEVETTIRVVERHPRALKSLGSPISRGFLLSGMSGNGKTKVVESVCARTDALLIRPDVVAVTDSDSGGSEKNLEAVFDSALRRCREGKTVLVFDPIDAFCPASGKPRARRRALRFLSLLDDFLPVSDNLFVVGVTSQLRGGFDPGLILPGRLVTQVSVGIPTEKDACSLLCKLLDGVTVDESTEELAGRLCVECPGYSLADLVNLARELWESRPLTSEVVRNVKNKTKPGFSLARKFALQAAPRPDADLTWDSIGGLDEVKSALKRAVEWPLTHPEVFVRLGIAKPKGILLYGPPGCGKTRLVRVAAAAAKAHFLALDPAEIFSPFVGESEKTVSEAFRLARLGRRSVLFIDEIDSVVAARGSEKGLKRVHEAVLSALLNEMDGIGNVEPSGAANDKGYVLVVAATNRPGALDSALLRPGRFDWLIHVPAPDAESRVKILEGCSRRTPMAPDVDFRDLAARTEAASGADLENLCREAALLAMTESSPVVTKNHFEEILRTTRTTSISPSHLREIRDFERHRTRR